MVTMKNEAKVTELKTFPNISEIESINVDVELFDGKGTNSKNEDFEYKFFKGDLGEEIRVPVTVLAQLKEQIEANPELKSFKVSKKGENLNSSYTVIPLN